MRLFIATPLPTALRQRIEAEAFSLRRSLPPASWVRSDSYHLTWAFLDEQAPAIVEPLAERLRSSLRDVRPVEGAIGAPGFFPSPRRPRVGWLAIGPRDPLQRIADGVRSAAAGVGLQLDGREFTPHLTLVRIRRPWTPEDVTSFLGAFESFGSSPVPISVVSIFESRLLPGGAQHTVLRSVELS